MGLEYRYRTRAGVVRIVQREPDNWRAMLDDDDLGGYGTPELALSDLTGGHTHLPSSRVDTSTLDLPDSLVDWELARIS